MISPLNRRAMRTASADFPDAVGPTIAIILFDIFLYYGTIGADLSEDAMRVKVAPVNNDVLKGELLAMGGKEEEVPHYLSINTSTKKVSVEPSYRTRIVLPSGVFVYLRDPEESSVTFDGRRVQVNGVLLHLQMITAPLPFELFDESYVHPLV